MLLSPEEMAVLSFWPFFFQLQGMRVAQYSDNYKVDDWSSSV